MLFQFRLAGYLNDVEASFFKSCEDVDDDIDRIIESGAFGRVKGIPGISIKDEFSEVKAKAYLSEPLLYDRERSYE